MKVKLQIDDSRFGSGEYEVITEWNAPCLPMVDNWVYIDALLGDKIPEGVTKNNSWRVWSIDFNWDKETGEFSPTIWIEDVEAK